MADYIYTDSFSLAHNPRNWVSLRKRRVAALGQSSRITLSRFLLVVCGGGCKTNSNEFSAGIVPCDCRLHFLPILRYDELNLCPLDIFALHLSSVHISACYSLRLLSSPTLISPCSRSSTRLSGPLAPRPLILTAESPSLPEVHGVCVYRLPLLKLMSLPRYRLRDFPLLRTYGMPCHHGES